MRERKSGILLHISSLPSPFGIGDLGPEAFKFADFLHESGQTYWQVLPLNPTELPYGSSPYSGPSSYAGNPLFISPELLAAEGYIAGDEIKKKPRFGRKKVNYEAAASYKTALLKSAFGNAREGLREDASFLEFCGQNKYWLDDYCLYTVLKQKLHSGTWRGFPKELRDRDESAIAEWGEKTEDETLYHKFVQYLFFSQWYGLEDHCRKRGVKLIGDIPYYVNFDSSEVWSSPGAFKLDAEKNPLFVSGVPPDYFSKTGQLWGNPVYDWSELRRAGYKWWIDRIGHNLSLFDVLRLDHFRGFVAYWEIKAGEKTALKGKWAKIDAVSFFDTLFSHYEKERFIAEDLGDITPDVREIIKRYSLPGMKILLFAFGDDFPYGEYLPSVFKENCVVYTGTHDNNTVRGWWENEAGNKEKNRIFEYLGKKIKTADISSEFIRLAMFSPADTAVIPMQDILGLGADARMNTPAVRKGNWEWRLGPGYASQELADRLSAITRKSNRY